MGQRVGVCEPSAKPPPHQFVRDVRGDSGWLGIETAGLRVREWLFTPPRRRG